MFRLFVALTAIAVAFPVLAEDPKVPGPKIEWPEVKGLTRGKTTVFPSAELGYSVPYTSPGMAVTVYVYNSGLAKIPTGADSDVVKGEMKQTVAALEAAKKQGLYKSVKETGKEEVVKLGAGKDAPAALKRMFELERKEGEVFSEAYVLGYKDHFVKLRATYSPDQKDEATKKIAALLEALGTTLK